MGVHDRFRSKAVEGPIGVEQTAPPRVFGVYLRFAVSAALLVGLGLLVDWHALGNAARALSWSVLLIAAAILEVQVLVGAWRAFGFLRLAGSEPDASAV